MSMNEFVNSLTPEQKKALMSALMSDTTVNTVQEQKPTVDDDFIVRRNNTLPSNKRREPVKAKQNQWTDTGEFKDVETPKVERTPRKRESPKNKAVSCHVCGKPFKVDPRFVYGEYYRCNRCVGTK